MKKIVSNPCVLFCFLFLAGLLACRKEGDKKTIVLYDKPLPTIQSNIVGKWILDYEKGGVAYGIYPQKNFVWTFTSNNRVLESYHDTVVVDTTISWYRDEGLFIGPKDSTYLMKFWDKEGVPWVFVLDRIVDDTLMIHENAFDCFYYHFTKMK